MKLRKSSEDYLEAMLMMQERHGYIRSIDVAAQLGVTKPSVSYATRHLREAGYIVMDGDNHIRLTESGLAVAGRVYTRHKRLTEFFVRLGVDRETAQQDACKVEHDLSEQTFAAICRHAEQAAFDEE